MSLSLLSWQRGDTDYLVIGMYLSPQICPMGIFQDIVTWISKKTAKKKGCGGNSPARNKMLGSIGCNGDSFFFGFTVILGLLNSNKTGRLRGMMQKISIVEDDIEYSGYNFVKNHLTDATYKGGGGGTAWGDI